PPAGARGRAGRLRGAAAALGPDRGAARRRRRPRALRRAGGRRPRLDSSRPSGSPAPSSMPKLGNLASRLLVAVIAVPLLLLAIYQDEAWVVWALVTAASLSAMDECFLMGGLVRADRRVGVVLGAAITVGFYWLPARVSPATLGFVAAVLVPALYYLFRVGEIASAATRLVFT